MDALQTPKDHLWLLTNWFDEYAPRASPIRRDVVGLPQSRRVCVHSLLELWRYLPTVAR